jgi:hypothetical protein
MIASPNDGKMAAAAVYPMKFSVPAGPMTHAPGRVERIWHSLPNRAQTRESEYQIQSSTKILYLLVVP